MKIPRCKYRIALAGAVIAAVYLAALAALALQFDRRSIQDLNLRSLQAEAMLRGLGPESFEGAGSIPRVFTWQRAILVDEDRTVLADTGWLGNDALVSGIAVSPIARLYSGAADLRRTPEINEERLARLLREAPESGWFGLLDARTIGAGRPIVRCGRGYGVALLVDKRDLIVAKHLDHLVLLVAFVLVVLLPAMLVAFYFARLVLPLARLARAVGGLERDGASRAAEGAPRAGAETADGAIELPGESRRDEVGLVSSAVGNALREARMSRSRLEDFINDALHELKNPLASLRGRLELTRMKGPGPEGAFTLGAGELDRLLADVGRAERLVSSLTALSAADSQDVSGASRPVELIRDLVAAYVELGRPVSLAPSLPEEAVVPADPEVVSGIVRILVDNALDFSPPGEGPTVSASLEGGYLVVSVADRGTGVPPNLREWIFGRFAGTRKGGAEPHSGLGLAIARSLASRIRIDGLRASIAVHDNPGGGAVFSLRLPLANRGSRA
jgi:signal transduction histidine kinase